MIPERMEIVLPEDRSCADEGHVWTPAGGGMLICAGCEETTWADEEGSTDAPEHDHDCCPPDDCCGGPCAAHPCWELTT